MTPMLLTVQGTGVADPFGPGFAGDVGRGTLTNPWQIVADKLDGIATPPPKWYWQPVGYPAGVFPMTPSVEDGKAEVSRLITLHEQDGICPVGTPLAFSGYSQGAIVTGQFWRDYILNPAGLHHNRLNDVVGIIQFGDPLRCPGIAHGNEVAGFPVPKNLDGEVTGGIAGPGCLTAAQTPAFLLSCALDGDLYGAAPVGSDPWNNEPLVGQVETRIYEFIESGSLMDGIFSIAKGIAQEFEHPLSNTIALVHAIFNGLKFAAAGTAAPHWMYQDFVPPMVDWLQAQV